MHPYPAEPLRQVITKGSDEEIGRQHGEQVGAAAREGMVKFYVDFWRRALNIRAEGALRGGAVRFGKAIFHKLMVDPLVAQIPEWARARLRGAAQSTGNGYEDMLTVLVLPDLLPILQAYLTKVSPRTFIEFSAPRFGCSSFISHGRHFLHGRNLDFPGVAHWDRFPVIQLTQKTGALKVVSFTTAGVPIGGITGINEAQIGVSLHQHYGAKTSLRGSLPFVIAEEILETARTLPEAEEILRRAKVASAWAFLVYDGKTRRGFIYETHAQAGGMRGLNDDEPLLTHSNYFQTPECRPAEYATSCRMNWDNYSRKNRLEELVVSRRGELTMADGARFLSDHYDPYWGEEKPFNRTVSQVYNIQSVVIDPVNMRALFAEGDAPIHLGHYREIDLGAIFAGRNGILGNTVPGYRFVDDAKARAKQEYILGFISAFADDLGESLRRVRGSLVQSFTAEAALVAAILEMKNGEYDAAIDLLQQGRSWIESRMREKGLTQPPPEFFETELFLARAWDLCGQRPKAVRMYQEVATHPGLQDRNLRRLAAAEGPYRPAQLARVVMPFSCYIPFA